MISVCSNTILQGFNSSITTKFLDTGAQENLCTFKSGMRKRYTGWPKVNSSRKRKRSRKYKLNGEKKKHVRCDRRSKEGREKDERKRIYRYLDGQQHPSHPAVVSTEGGVACCLPDPSSSKAPAKELSDRHIR